MEFNCCMEYMELYKDRMKLYVSVLLYKILCSISYICVDLNPDIYVYLFNE